MDRSPGYTQICSAPKGTNKAHDWATESHGEAVKFACKNCSAWIYRSLDLSDLKPKQMRIPAWSMEGSITLRFRSGTNEYGRPSCSPSNMIVEALNEDGDVIGVVNNVLGLKFESDANSLISSAVVTLADPELLITLENPVLQLTPAPVCGL